MGGVGDGQEKGKTHQTPKVIGTESLGQSVLVTCDNQWPPPTSLLFAELII